MKDRRLIGVISDTHGLLRPQVVDAFRGVELIVHAGDVGKEHVLEQLREIAPVAAVRGNVDIARWATRLSEREVIKVEQVELYVLHDLSKLDLDPSAAGFRAVIYGHSHRPFVNEKGGVLYLNPGSAGPQRFDLPVSVALLQIEDGAVQARLVQLEIG